MSYCFDNRNAFGGTFGDASCGVSMSHMAVILMGIAAAVSIFVALFSIITVIGLRLIAAVIILTVLVLIAVLLVFRTDAVRPGNRKG